MQTTLQSDVKVYLCDALPTSGSFNEGDIALVFNFTSGIMGYRCMTVLRMCNQGFSIMIPPLASQFGTKEAEPGLMLLDKQYN